MKQFIAIFTVLLFAAGCQQQKSATEPVTTTIDVKAMRCSMCVTNVKNAVTPLAGVEQCEVDLQAKTATVRFVPAKLELSTIEKAIADAGYDANNTKRNEEAYAKLQKCCQ